MRAKLKFLICILASVCCRLVLLSQNSKADSLFSLIKKDKADTLKVFHLNKLSWEFINAGNFDTALYFSNSALQLANSLNLSDPSVKRGISAAYGYSGIAYFSKGNSPKALENYLQALKIDEAVNNKKGMGRHLGNIGVVYIHEADYSKALSYYQRALKINEEVNDKKGIGTWLGNIGNVYKEIGNYPKALSYYINALKISEEAGNKFASGRWFGNIGNVYFEQGDSATKKENEAYALAEKNPKALENYFQALRITEEYEDRTVTAVNLANIVILFVYTKKYSEAEKYLFRSVALSDSIGFSENIKTSCK
ncbi:MAG: tetratricopeptide repeat protein, partial [Bacteroidia bacterium]|nr:tetratricopeptide repeat protein [Bacteroidia bacterium]